MGFYLSVDVHLLPKALTHVPPEGGREEPLTRAVGGQVQPEPEIKTTQNIMNDRQVSSRDTRGMIFINMCKQRTGSFAHLFFSKGFN